MVQTSRISTSDTPPNPFVGSGSLEAEQIKPAASNSADYKVYSQPWSSADILQGMRASNTSRALTLDPDFRAIIRNDTESEFDATNFLHYLEERVAQGKLKLSPEFNLFLDKWSLDEQNHTQGLMMIESFLYKIPLKQIYEEVSAVPPNFKKLQELGLLKDEFTIALVIAYDEIATTFAYLEDKKDRYPKFENPALVSWISHVAADESRHFANVVNLIKRNFSDRIHEIPAVLNKIFEWERSEHKYERTFVLDHTGIQFTEGFISKAAETLLHKFGFITEN